MSKAQPFNIYSATYKKFNHFNNLLNEEVE